MKKKYLGIALAASVLAIGLICAGFATGTFRGFFSAVPSEKELLASIPKIDISKYNRFMFNVSIDAGNAEGEAKGLTESGPLELYGDISHLYDQDVSAPKSGYEANEESWADFSSGKRYRDSGLGDGWTISEIKNEHAIKDLVRVINERDDSRIMTMTDTACTVSWRFEADLDYLFGRLLSDYTDDLKLSGYGRATAVFNPKTYKFQYFTFIISASNSERAGAMLDSVFYWEIMNDDGKRLPIPQKIISKAYEGHTGIASEGGFDQTVTPLAERFMGAFGGEARTVCDESSASMFWTMKNNDMSATVNYTKTENPKDLYEENYKFLTSFYGAEPKDGDKKALFYDESTGTLTYITNGENYYAEIIIAGPPDTKYDELKKELETYKPEIGA